VERLRDRIASAKLVTCCESSYRPGSFRPRIYAGAAAGSWPRCLHPNHVLSHSQFPPFLNAISQVHRSQEERYVSDGRHHEHERSESG
jgi:hypothetical protein